MDTKRKGRLPVPRTPAQVQLDIVNIGGIIEYKPLCPPFRGEVVETTEGTPLISDEVWDWWACEERADVCMSTAHREAYEAYRAKGRVSR